MPVKLFFCYAHEDRNYLNKLKKHLTPLLRENLISTWHDVDISPGVEWEKEINKHLNTAKIILLLVSPDFMVSEYCYSKEMLRAMERHDQGEARVVPISLRPTHWKGAPFGKLQALPTDAKPVTDPTWHNLDIALFNVAEGIRKVVEEISRQSPPQKLHHSSRSKGTQSDQDTKGVTLSTTSPPLSHPSASIVPEEMVSQLPVSQEPTFTTYEEVRKANAPNFLKEQKADTSTAQMNEFVAQQHAFDLALRSSIPGTSLGYVQAKNKEEINRVLSSLAKHLKACNLWWFEDNTAANSADPIKNLSEDIWLIDTHECDIVDLWIYRHPTEERQYVIVHLAPRPMFGIYDYNLGNTDTSTEVADYNVEEAAYFRGIYVTRGEYDDGYALIEGKVVKLKGAEIRTRNLKDNFLVLAPKMSIYNLYNHATYNKQIKEVYNALLAAGKITPSILTPLEYLKRPSWMSAWD